MERVLKLTQLTEVWWGHSGLGHDSERREMSEFKEKKQTSFSLSQASHFTFLSPQSAWFANLIQTRLVTSSPFPLPHPSSIHISQDSSQESSVKNQSRFVFICNASGGTKPLIPHKSKEPAQKLVKNHLVPSPAAGTYLSGET